jgi:hypothetical protein
MIYFKILAQVIISWIGIQYPGTKVRIDILDCIILKNFFKSSNTKGLGQHSEKTTAKMG